MSSFLPAPSTIVVFSFSIDLLGAAEHVERDVLELDAEVFADHLAAGQDRDVLEHRLAAVAEARRLDGGDLQAAAQLVDDQVASASPRRLRRRSAAAAGLHHGFEHRQHRLQARRASSRG